MDYMLHFIITTIYSTWPLLKQLILQYLLYYLYVFLIMIKSKLSTALVLLLFLVVIQLTYGRNMNVTCSPEWMVDTQSFAVDVKWDIFDNINVNNIKMLAVTFRQYNEDLSDQVYFREFDKPIIQDTYSYNMTDYGIVPYTYYEQVVNGSNIHKPITAEYSFQGSFKVTSPPLFGICQFLLQPSQPSVARNTEIITSDLSLLTGGSTDRMVVVIEDVKFQWSVPSDPIVSSASELGYEVWIGGSRSGPGDVYNLINISAINESVFSGMVESNIKLVDVTSSAKYIFTKLRCFYTVVSMDNGTHRIYSDWSEDLPMSIISDKDSHTTTTIVPTSTRHSEGSVTHITQSASSNVSITTQSADDITSNGVNNGVIYLTLGLLMLVMFVIILAVSAFALIVCVRRRKKFKVLSRELDSEASFQEEDLSIFKFKGGSRSPLTAAPISNSNSSSQHNLFEGSDEWELPMQAVIMHEKLGGGCFGLVFRGEVNGFKNTHLVAYESRRSAGRYVAVKLLKDNASNQEKNEFLEEIELMKIIAQGHNPHVVNMLGAVTRQEPMCVVTEYLEYGDLLGYLKKCRTNLNDNVTDNKAYVFDHEMLPESIDLILFAYQIASGMEYLSSMKVIHRDLACRNVLVGEGNRIKISDFGLSRNMTYDSAYVKTSSGPLPIRWMAIESIMYHEFTTASDVWSFGITLWEIGTLGAIPYTNMANSDILHSLKIGNRVDKPSAISDEVYEIMLKCFSDNPAHRPTFTELKKDFDLLLSKEKNTHDMYLDLREVESEATPITNDQQLQHPVTSATTTPTRYLPAANDLSPHYSPIPDNITSPCTDHKGPLS